MKLTTAFCVGVFALGSTSAMADHRYRDNGRHDNYRHHEQARHHYKKASRHYRIAGRYERAARREHRNDRVERDYGRVIDVEPVYRYYKEPVNAHSCLRRESGGAAYSSYTGTVLGAVIGGALGHRIGDAHGDPTAAAVAGGLLGASVGRDLDKRASYNRGLGVEGPCRIRETEATRRQLVEYKVTYRYNGQVHRARMDHDPGEWVKLDVDVTPA